VAAARYEIELILPSAMSNHHHGVVYDRHGREVEFRGYFHGLIARAMNSLRGRSENFWSSDEPCVVELVDPADVMDKLVYAATNPVAGAARRAGASLAGCERAGRAPGGADADREAAEALLPRRR
jgi:hypothetical protein